MSQTYRVVIKGIKEGQSKDQIVSNLASLFKLTEDRVHSMLATSSFVIKRGIDAQTAEKYIAAVERCGAICVAEADSPISTVAAKPPVPKKATDAKSNANVYCNQCEFELPTGAKFCPSCGANQNQAPAIPNDAQGSSFAAQVIPSKSDEHASMPQAVHKIPKWMIYTVVGLLALVVAVTLLSTKLEKSSNNSQGASVAGDESSSGENQQATAAPVDTQTYEATLTCGMGSSDNINILACFAGSDGADTELELKNGDQYGMYKAYNMSGVGREDRQGFHIHLKHNFSIKVQNSSENLILSLTIKDENGKVVFQKSVAQFGVIAVSN